jgi:hypothetical protein
MKGPGRPSLMSMDMMPTFGIETLDFQAEIYLWCAGENE